MKAIIKEIHSPDININNYWPEDEENFGFLLQVMIGPESEEGSESFDIMVCTPDWIKNNLSGQKAIWGLHYLIVFEYNITFIKKYISNYLVNCTGSNWQDIAKKISYIGKWEFENYTT